MSQPRGPGSFPRSTVAVSEATKQGVSISPKPHQDGSLYSLPTTRNKSGERRLVGSLPLGPALIIGDSDNMKEAVISNLWDSIATNRLRSKFDDPEANSFLLGQTTLRATSPDGCFCLTPLRWFCRLNLNQYFMPIWA